MVNSNRIQQLELFAKQLTLTFSEWELLDQALTHASACNDNPNCSGHYETLEFLGDATLELAISHILYQRNPKGSPGSFTQLRALIVNKNALATVGRSLGIGPLIQLGKGEDQSGGRERDALLADCIEAILAAIYLSLGWDTVYSFIEKHFMDIIQEAESSINQLDYRSQLQNYCQAKKMELPTFKIVSEEGPAHQKTFEIKVFLGSQDMGTGRGASKKSAEQAAAREALNKKGVASSEIDV